MLRKVPVAIIIYKRPDETKQLMSRLEMVRPEKLYVIADAPNNPDDVTACDAAYHIATHPTWNCEILTNRSSTNMGCRKRVSSGLDWLFIHEEEAIILEDDLLPSESFFRFAVELLHYFRDDEQVMHISGNNHQQGKRRTEASYTFSKHTHCWGWATWRRAWQKYESDMQSWPAFRDSGELDKICPDPLEKEYFTKWLNWVHKGEKDSWAYVWTYSMWKAGGLGINPEVNLVQNIGFGETATHTHTASGDLSNTTSEMQWPLIHPRERVHCEEADNYTFYKAFEGDEIVAARSFSGKLRQWRNGVFRRLKRFQK